MLRLLRDSAVLGRRNTGIAVASGTVLRRRCIHAIPLRCSSRRHAPCRCRTHPRSSCRRRRCWLLTLRLLLVFRFGLPTI